jgi:hypothetical protein
VNPSNKSAGARRIGLAIDNQPNGFPVRSYEQPCIALYCISHQRVLLTGIGRYSRTPTAHTAQR